MSIEKYRINSKKTFDRSAKNYYSTFFGKHAKDLYGPVMEAISAQFTDNQSILDIGCGTGNLIKILHQKYANAKIAGIDLSPAMISEAKKNNNTPDVDFRTGDSENLPWADNTFDLIICTDSFHHYPLPEKVLLEMYRVLKDKGTLIISEIWLPPGIRQLVNIVLPFMKTGDVRVYSQREMMKMSIQAGFSDFQWKILNPMAYLCTVIRES